MREQWKIKLFRNVISFVSIFVLAMAGELLVCARVEAREPKTFLIFDSHLAITCHVGLLMDKYALKMGQNAEFYFVNSNGQLNDLGCDVPTPPSKYAGFYSAQDAVEHSTALFDLKSGILRSLAEQLQAGDQVVLQIAAHGQPKGVIKEKRPFLRGSNRKPLPSTPVEFSEMHVLIGNAEGGEWIPISEFRSFRDRITELGGKLAILDESCFSGGALNILADKNTCVLTGTDRHTISYANNLDLHGEIFATFWDLVLRSNKKRSLSDYFVEARSKKETIDTAWINNRPEISNRAQQSFRFFFDPIFLSDIYGAPVGTLEAFDQASSPIQALLKSNSVGFSEEERRHIQELLDTVREYLSNSRKVSMWKAIEISQRKGGRKSNNKTLSYFERKFKASWRQAFRMESVVYRDWMKHFSSSNSTLGHPDPCEDIRL